MHPLNNIYNDDFEYEQIQPENHCFILCLISAILNVAGIKKECESIDLNHLNPQCLLFSCLHAHLNLLF